MARNPDLDMTFDCLGYDRLGNYGIGIISLGLDISGERAGISITGKVIDFGLDVSGVEHFSTVLPGSAIDFGDISISADVIFSPPVDSLIKWSKIGEFDFTIDRQNLAGEMPMDWRGVIWAILKLGSGVMVYGSGGVTQLLPKANVYAMKTLTRVGWACISR